jgi:isocitrate/isopropylmalate dehydrogenase
MAHTITHIPGDGVGPAFTESVFRGIEHAGTQQA